MVVTMNGERIGLGTVRSGWSGNTRMYFTTWTN